MYRLYGFTGRYNYDVLPWRFSRWRLKPHVVIFEKGVFSHYFFPFQQFLFHFSQSMVIKVVFKVLHAEL